MVSYRIGVLYFVGFVVAVDRKGTNQFLTENEIKKYIPHIEASIENWLAYWEYPLHEVEVPNFKFLEENDLYFKLFDSQFFEVFIKKCIDRINILFP